MSNLEQTNTSIVKFTTTIATLFIIAIMLIPAFVEPQFSMRTFRVGFAEISIGLLMLLVGFILNMLEDLDRRYLVTAWLLIVPIIAIQMISAQTFEVFDGQLFSLVLGSIAAIIGIIGLIYIRKQLTKMGQLEEWRSYLNVSRLFIMLVPSAYFILYIFIAVVEDTFLFDYQMLYPVLLWFLILNSGLLLLTFGEKKA